MVFDLDTFRYRIRSESSDHFGGLDVSKADSDVLLEFIVELAEVVDDLQKEIDNLKSSE